MKVGKSLLITFAEVLGGGVIAYLLGPRLKKKDGSPLIKGVPPEALLAASALAAALFGPTKYAHHLLAVSMGAAVAPAVAWAGPKLTKSPATKPSGVHGSPFAVGGLPSGAAIYALPPPSAWGQHQASMYQAAGFPIG